MSKQYRLKKDLPDSKAGDIYEWVECIGVNNGGVYYLKGDIRLSYWQKENVENNHEWFEEVVASVQVTITENMDLHDLVIVSRGALEGMGVKQDPDVFEVWLNSSLSYADNKKYFDSMAAMYGITAPNPSNTIVSEEELEKCWNAARMKDHFSRAISQPFKYATFQDYIDKKPARHENRKDY